ncbi:MAG: alpha-amylase family protein [Propionibacteriaceae bacterium]|nr:alpha-amylase family protein [Propionibacteriaceae bacterium]
MGWVEHAIWWQVYPLGFCGAPIRRADGAGVINPAQTNGAGQIGEETTTFQSHSSGGGPSGGSTAITGNGALRRLDRWLDYAIDLGASGLLLGPIFASTSHGYDTLDHFRIDPRLGDQSDFDQLLAACHQRGLRLLLDGVFGHVSRSHPLLARALSGDPAAAALFGVDWRQPDPSQLTVFEGHDDLVRFDHRSMATVELVSQIMSHWLSLGIDGWRLDTAYAIPAAFWAQVMPTVRRRFPESWVMGEMIHGDYAAFVRAAQIDSVTQYELWKAIWSSLKEGNFFELDWCLRRHNQLLGQFTPQTFIGNHDVSRIASQVGDRLAVLALTVLMTVGGIPSIYYGDEQGWKGVKEERFGGDDAIRPAFPDSPSDLPANGADMLRAHQQLIGLRRRHPWLTTARSQTIELTNRHYRYRLTSPDPVAWLEVTLDLNTTPQASISNASGEIIWDWGV